CCSYTTSSTFSF
nr:immunoglobulin light chain junction region [Macaca mulatta]